MKHLVVALMLAGAVALPGCAVPTTAASSKLGQGPGVTMENYLKLTTGMSYEEVVNILGVSGQESARTQAGDTEIVIYTWFATKGFGNMNATFQNNKLTTKAQAGLE